MQSVIPTTRPSFPEPGSTFGPDGRYFCLRRLGRGTFCSIHKCVDLSYFHHDIPTISKSNFNKKKINYRPRLRIVAAKVELSSFSNSGVLVGEATIHQYLSRQIPSGSVPIYVDYVKMKCYDNNGDKENFSAIIMECLIGEDMHHLRDRHCQNVASISMSTPYVDKTSIDIINIPHTHHHISRRLNIKDAVYLCADVILPLLQNLHDVGIIHRDVKPSNFVRSGIDRNDRSLKIVDFGLSKSFVVPQSSSYSDKNYEWTKSWYFPSNFDITSDHNHCDKQNTTCIHTRNETNHNITRIVSTKGFLRKERPEAEFRGTSMYASLRVHQSHDYCRRDDLWSLIYVFCDLISGGLPWMDHAANRDRNMCRVIKEWVHGNDNIDDIDLDGKGQKNKKSNGDDMINKHVNHTTKVNSKQEATDRIEELLKGSSYHLSKFKTIDSICNSSSENFPQPLAMSTDIKKVNGLRRVFEHLSSLGFSDEPDYDLVRNCLKEFSLDNNNDTNIINSVNNKGDIVTDVNNTNFDIPPIDWEQPTPEEAERLRRYRMGIRKNINDKISPKCSSKESSSFSRPVFVLKDKNDIDPLDDALLNEAERTRQLESHNDGSCAIGNGYSAFTSRSPGIGAGMVQLNSSVLTKRKKWSEDIDDLLRLPLHLQFKLSQVEYNASQSDTIPIHLALRDWMALASTLVYDEWNSAKYERGGHRTNNDGYRRELYMRIMCKCIDAAVPFENFSSRNCFYYTWDNEGNFDDNGKVGDVMEKVHSSTLCRENENNKRNNKRKRRNIYVGSVERNSSKSNDVTGSSLVAFSKVIFALRTFIEVERERLVAPPPAIVFGCDQYQV